MSIINKIYLKNAQGENIEYDIAADAQNVQYDASHNIKDVVNNLDSDVDTLNNTVTSVSSTVSTHVAASVTSDDGVHDFRYNNGSLQVNINGQWTPASINLSGEKGINVANGKVGHTNNITSGTIGSSSNTSGVSLEVPYANYDGQGHITSKGNRTHTIPTATSSALGVSRPDGTTITVNNGVLSASGTSYSSGTGISISNNVINHSNSITSGTIGSSSSTSGASISIPWASYDGQGHITGKGNRTHTVPVATKDSAGVVRPDGSSIVIDNNGIISVNVEGMNYSLMTGSDTNIKALIDGYYDGTYTLDDIKSILAVGDNRKANATDKSAFQVESHTMNIRVYDYDESQYKTNYVLPKMETVILTILDFNHDTLQDSIGSITKALLTIQMYGTVGPRPDARLDVSYLNSYIDTPSQGYVSTNLATYIATTFLNACHFKDLTKKVMKESSYTNGTKYNTPSSMDLISETEICGSYNQKKGLVDEGTQYEYYTIRSRLTRHLGYEGAGNSASYYCLRTLSQENPTKSFCAIDRGGTSTTYAYGGGPIAPVSYL